MKDIIEIMERDTPPPFPFALYLTEKLIFYLAGLHCTCSKIFETNMQHLATFYSNFDSTLKLDHVSDV